MLLIVLPLRATLPQALEPTGMRDLQPSCLLIWKLVNLLLKPLYAGMCHTAAQPNLHFPLHLIQLADFCAVNPRVAVLQHSNSHNHITHAKPATFTAFPKTLHNCVGGSEERDLSAATQSPYTMCLRCTHMPACDENTKHACRSAGVCDHSSWTQSTATCGCYGKAKAKYHIIYAVPNIGPGRHSAWTTGSPQSTAPFREVVR